MKRLALLALLSIYLALPARAAEPQHVNALIDGNCTDSFNGGLANSVFGTFTVTSQTSGTADGKCDSDNRVLTGAQTADVIFGPFTALPGQAAIEVIAEASATTASNGTWTVCLAVEKPYEPYSVTATASDLVVLSCAANSTGAVSDTIMFGSLGIAVSQLTGSTTFLVGGTIILPKTYYLLLDLNGGIGSSSATTVTSWTGSLGIVQAN